MTVLLDPNATDNNGGKFMLPNKSPQSGEKYEMLHIWIVQLAQ